MNRNPIYTALFNLLKTTTGIVQAYQFLRQMSDITTAQLPCLMQRQITDEPKNTKGEPGILHWRVDAYIVVGNQADILDNPASAPAIQLNTYLDAIDAALQPDPVTQVQTLGGLVSHCWRANTDYYEDPKTQRGMLMVGIELLVTADSSAQFAFDSGKIYAIDASGTPQLLGSLQNMTVTQKFTTKVERGNFVYDFKVNRVATKLSVHAKFAQIKGAVLAQLVNGAAVSTGSQNVASLVSATVPASPGPYAVTPVVPSSGTWAQDMGVIYDGGARAGQALTQVGSNPIQGQYSVTAGVYTFAAADAATAVSISFLYTLTSGKSLTISDVYQGPAPTFQAVLNSTDKNGNQVTWNLPVCYSDQLEFPTRLEEFTVPDFEFSVIGTNANPPIIGTLSFSQ